jgi:hypothetical protein
LEILRPFGWQEFGFHLAHAVKNGHMDDYSPEDYRIVGVPA